MSSRLGGRGGRAAELARTEPLLLVFYDADCGFCARCARLLHRLDGRRRLGLRPLQTAAQTVSDAPGPAALVETIHVRDAGGRWTKGGAAWVRVALEVPALRPLGLAAGLPVIRALVEPTYALVAANRHKISRLLGDDACSTDAKAH